jgi:stage II sporulation protein D
MRLRWKNLRLVGSPWCAGLGLLLIGIGAGCAGRRGPETPGGPAPAVPVHPGRPIRVAVALGAKVLQATGTEPLVLVVGGEAIGRFRAIACEPEGGRSVRIRPTGHPPRAMGDTLRLSPAPGSVLALDGKGLRGDLLVFNDGSDGLVGVNELDLEDYLKGVVPLEIGNPPAESFEAVKAQAVAARTYAIAHLGRWLTFGFDLHGDERDQVYGGIPAEKESGTRAVAETAGIVATYGGALIGAYYSAACGGVTAAVEETWSFPPEDYLKPHRDRLAEEDFCRLSRHYRWQERWTTAELGALLARYYVGEFGGPAPAGEVEAAAVVSRNSSGRVKELRMTVGGRHHSLRGDRIRWVLRRAENRILRSTSFELEEEREAGNLRAVVARGRGNGHGVGMCQSGALEMAKEGHAYDAILRHYYPGVGLERLREPRLSASPGYRSRGS